MKRKWPAIICLLVAVLFFAGYFILARSNSNVEDNKSRVQIGEVKAEEIAGIYYEYAGESYEFQRKNGAWIYTKDPDFPIDASFIDFMTVKLSDIVSTMRVGDVGDDNFKDLGFHNPTLIVRVTTESGKTFDYTVGSYNDVISRYYFLVGDQKQIHVIEQGFVNAFSLGLYGMIQKDAPPEFFTNAVTGFSIIKDGKTTRFDYYEDGLPGSYSELEKWTVDNGEVTDYPAGTGYVTNLLAYTGSGMVLDSCVFDRVSEQDYERFGFDSPSAVISVDYLDELSKQTNITYTIGNKVGEQYYIMCSGSDQVFLTSAEIAESLMVTDPESFKTRAIMLVKLDTIERLTLSCDKERYELQVERDMVTQSDGSTKSQVTFEWNEKEVSNPKVLDFYNTFFSLDSEKVLPTLEETDKVPYLTIAMERNTKNHPFMKLEFIPYDSNFYLVRFNGRSDQLIGVGKVEAILESARGLAQS